MMKRVFKFPDGKGGNVLKIRDDNGNWHLCDAEGNWLDEDNDEAPAADIVPEERTVRRKKNRKTHKNMKIAVVTDEQTAQLISDYAAWKAASEHKQISRAQLMLKAILGVISRDAEFSRFRKGGSDGK